jgi:lipopolysaccharide biosynthesis glycosyltransferase
MEQMEKTPMAMNIVFSVDDNGLEMLATAVFSVAKNNKNHRLDFYIIESDISKENKKKLKRIEQLGKYIKIHFINISQQRFNDIQNPRKKEITKQAFYRYLFPELKPRLNKALYMDFDTLCIADIKALYDTPLDGYYVGGVVDPGMPIICCDVLNWYKTTYNRAYINSGVLLMNLKEIRKDKKVKEFLESIKTRANMPVEHDIFADQTIANIVFGGKVKLLDQANNAMLAHINGVKSEPTILHFSGTHKAFTYASREYTESYMNIYWQYYDEAMKIIDSFEHKMIKSVIINLRSEIDDQKNKIAQMGDQEILITKLKSEKKEIENKIREHEALINGLEEQLRYLHTIRGSARNFAGKVKHSIISKGKK